MINKIKNKINADTHLKELLKGSSIAFVLRIIGIVAGYIFTLLVARLYGADVLGIFVLSLTLMQIFSVFGKAGMDVTSLRFVAELSSQNKWYTIKDFYKKVILFVIPVSLFVNLLFFLLSPLIATYVFKKPHLSEYFRILSIGYIPFVLLFIHSEAIRGLKKVAQYMFFQRAGIFIFSSVILPVFYLLFNGIVPKNVVPILVYLISLFSIFFSAVFLWNMYLKKKLANLKSAEPNEPLQYRTILSVSIPLLFAGTANLIMNWTDIIMLGMFRTEDEVGIYNVAQKIAMFVSLPLMAINTIAAPKFAEFWGKKDLKGLTKVAKQSTKMIFWFSFPVVLCFLLFPELLMGMFGESFKAGTLALIFLTLGQFVNAISGSVGYILQMTGNQVYYQNVILIGSIINILMNFVLIPIYGITGAAIASAVSMVYWNVAFGYKVKKILGKWVVYLPFV